MFQKKFHMTSLTTSKRCKKYMRIIISCFSLSILFVSKQLHSRSAFKEQKYVTHIDTQIDKKCIDCSSIFSIYVYEPTLVLNRLKYDFQHCTNSSMK